MFHVEIGVQLKKKPVQAGVVNLIPSHPGDDFSGSLASIVIMFTEYPGEFGYNENLWDITRRHPYPGRRKAAPWIEYAERFALRMTQKKWAEELRGATSEQLSIVVPKNGIGGNF